MSYTYKFMDNAYYGIEDLNNLVKSFTTGGVNVYSGTSGQLNDMTAALVGSGTQMWNEACKASIYNSQIKLNPGVVFFDDGSSLTIESGDEILPNGRYIYIKKDGENSRPVSSSTPPSSNDIPIAEYANGTLTDKRKFAKSKVAGFGANQYYETNINGGYALNTGTQSTPGYTTIQSIVFNYSPEVFNYAVFFQKDAGNFMTLGMMKFGADGINNKYRYLYITGGSQQAQYVDTYSMSFDDSSIPTDFWIKRSGGDNPQNMYLFMERRGNRIDLKIKNHTDLSSLTVTNSSLIFC